MASQAQADYVTDLAVQSGVLPVVHMDRCRADVLGWEHGQVTAAITYLKNRIWRARARATAKQVEYGERLLVALAALTDAESEELDFDAMNSLQATEELTRLESLLALLTALDTDPDALTPPDAPTMLTRPLTGALGLSEPDVADVFRQMARH